MGDSVGEGYFVSLLTICSWHYGLILEWKENQFHLYNDAMSLLTQKINE